jgi:hypothetical protein
MATIVEKGLESVAEELKCQRAHVVCVAAGGMTMCDHFASFVGKLDQREEVWPLTREVNELGLPRSFWPRLSLTAIPLPEWDGRPQTQDIEAFYMGCFEEVARINREEINLSTMHIDLNGWGFRYHFKLARQVAERVLKLEPSLIQIHFEPEAKGCRDTHV